MGRRRVLLVELLAALAAAALFCTLTLAHGIPVLKHDWSWPINWDALGAAFSQTTSAWQSDGIGHPSAYNGGYLVLTPFILVSYLITPLGGLIALLSSFCAICVYAVFSLSKQFRVRPTGTVAAILFSIFNPWVYNKLIAGHTLLLLNYAGTLALIAEVTKPKPSPKRLALLCALTISHPQFLLIGGAILLYGCIKRRTITPLSTLLILSAPMIVGVIVFWRSLGQIPYTLAWQETQSVSPNDGLLLLGYFANYSDIFNIWALLPLYIIVCLALVGVLTERSRYNIALAAMALLSILVASGTKGVLSSPYTYLVTRLIASGAFRELYNVLAVAAICYTILAMKASRLRATSFVFLVCTLWLVVPWLVKPPFAFFQSAGSLPSFHVPAISDSRFALLPAFQPLSLNGRGSGADLDAYARPGNVTPLNSYLPLYPTGVALANLSLNRSTALLKALSVSVVISRPYLRPADSGSPTGRLLSVPVVSQSNTLWRIDGVPELSLCSRPLIGTLDTNVGASNEFFGDAPNARSQVVAVTSSNVGIDSSKDWVDARLWFIQRPALAQAFGGALTTSRSAELPLRGGLQALVYVSGVLTDQRGILLARTTAGYQWIPIPKPSNALRCRGLCVLALQGMPPPNVVANPPPRPCRALSFTALLPWLVVTDQTDATGELRYNVFYAPAWIALDGRATLPHTRLDAVVNGWTIDKRQIGHRFVLVNADAAAIALLQAIATVWFLSRLFLAATPTLRTRKTSTFAIGEKGADSDSR